MADESIIVQPRHVYLMPTFYLQACKCQMVVLIRKLIRKSSISKSIFNQTSSNWRSKSATKLATIRRNHRRQLSLRYFPNHWVVVCSNLVLKDFDFDILQSEKVKYAKNVAILTFSLNLKLSSQFISAMLVGLALENHGLLTLLTYSRNYHMTKVLLQLTKIEIYSTLYSGEPTQLAPKSEYLVRK